MIRSNPSLTELKDRYGRTALDLACFQGEVSCARLLIGAGASCDSHDDVDGRTPVHAAAYTNNIDCLRAMVTMIDEPPFEILANSRDLSGRTPLMYATEQGHLSTISFLINEMNAHVLLADHRGRTALHRAV